MSNKPNIDDYLNQGIYGTKEIKPEERNQFLGTLRERVVAVLTQQQVREPGTYIELEELLKLHPKATLYLNGNITYTYLSDYIKLANKHDNGFKLVTNKKVNSELGLVLAYDYAVDQENIYINKNEEHKEKEDENFFSSFFKRLFQ
ncbi:YueI family protein [Bacillus sp. AK128]